MKKLLFALSLIPALAFFSCPNNQPTAEERIAEEINKNTTLELKFLEDVSEKDLSAFVPDYDIFGGFLYYNSGYEEGDEYYVRYLVSAYPDYADGGSVVTRIDCTDPNVTFFDGCTVENCDALFGYLSGEGFEIINSGDNPSSVTNATNGKITVSHDSKSKIITFSYEVSNRDGIVF